MKKLKFCLFFAFLIISLSFIAQTALATPNISGVSGTVSNGSQITITGSGFGTKSPAAPDKWHNFENLNVDNIVDTSGVFYQYNPAHDILISDAVKRNIGVAEKAVHQWFSPADGYDQYMGRRGVSYNSIYLSGWYYFTLGEGTGRTRNYKLFGFRGTIGDPTDGYPEFRWDMYETTGKPNCTHYGSGHNYTAGCTGGDYLNDWGIGWDDWVADEGTWVRVEIWVDLDHGGENGCWYIWRNCSEWNSQIGQATNGDCNFKNIYVSHYYATDECNPKRLDIYWDELYFDTTRARIEIGNANTWAGCTHREIQIPSAWATGEVTATVNRGSFGASDTAYLYVVDSDGNVNANGYPITIGGAADTTPPAAPTGVTVI